MALNFKDMKIDDIITWCEANNQIEWLKTTADEKTEYKEYPKKKVAALNADGTPILTKKGKPTYKTVADKTGTPVIKTHPITFIEVKTRFCEKFMPELIPAKKEEKISFHDRIKKL